MIQGNFSLLICCFPSVFFPFLRAAEEKPSRLSLVCMPVVVEDPDLVTRIFICLAKNLFFVAMIRKEPSSACSEPIIYMGTGQTWVPLKLDG
jgi:hypothetical protein